MTPYLLGLVFFFGLPVRVRFGEAPSLGIYSVVSLIAAVSRVLKERADKANALVE